MKTRDYSISNCEACIAKREYMRAAFLKLGPRDKFDPIMTDGLGNNRTLGHLIDDGMLESAGARTSCRFTAHGYKMAAWLVQEPKR